MCANSPSIILQLATRHTPVALLLSPGAIHHICFYDASLQLQSSKIMIAAPQGEKQCSDVINRQILGLYWKDSHFGYSLTNV